MKTMRMAACALAVLMVTACQNDDTMSGPRARAQGPAIPAPGVPTVTTSGDATTITVVGGDGHTYAATVREGGVSDHYQDGQLFAEVRSTSSGDSVATYIGSAVVNDQFIYAGSPIAGPLATRQAENIRLPEDRPRHDDRFGPQPQTLIPCVDEMSAYANASINLVAATAWWNVNRANKKAAAYLASSAINFVAAWRNLYRCEVMANGG